MGVNIHITSGPVLDKASDLAGLLTSLQENDVLFIDEIHRLNRVVEEYLYPAMEDYRLDIMLDSGPTARSVNLPLKHFTLVGATTRSGLLNDVYREMTVNLLRPAVLVDYVREAYLHPAEEVRITFDKQLRTGLWSKDLFNPYVPTIPPFDENLMILEVKYNKSLPSYIRDILNTYCQGACVSAISKYTWCRRFEFPGEEA